MNQYEGMFLFDPTFATPFENCEAEVRRLMERAGAEIVFCRKWDERRLAYKVQGRKRGVYVLVYFKAPADKITSLERDVQISENILRILVLRADEVTQEMMEAAVASHGAEAGVEGSGDSATGSAGGSSDKPRAQAPAESASKESAPKESAPTAVASEVATTPEAPPSDAGTTAVLDPPPE